MILATESPLIGALVQCRACHGNGYKFVKIKLNRKSILETVQCKVCLGTKLITKLPKQKKKVIKSYPSFVAPGIFPYAITSGIVMDENPLLQPNDDEELCYLTGNFKVFQHLCHHRYSTDDLLTSYYAYHALKRIYSQLNNSIESSSIKYLDIGCGLGSVLLSTSWLLSNNPNVTSTGVETQMSRYNLCQRNIYYNYGYDAGIRINVINCDLRRLELQHRFDLITGTPPYFKSDIKHEYPDSMESAGCLFELRGGVEEYITAAHKYLNLESMDKPSIFVMCNTSLASSRVYLACHENNMNVVERIDVIPKEGRLCLFCIFTIVHDKYLDILGKSNHRLFPQLTPITELVSTQLNSTERGN